MDINFDKSLKIADYFFGEDNDNGNKMFNVVQVQLAKLYDEFYNRTERHKEFSKIDGLEREKIFCEALEDYMNTLSKDFI